MLDVTSILPDVTPDAARRLAREAEHALAVLATINNMLAARRQVGEANALGEVETPNAQMMSQIQAIQCAALKFYYEIIPNEGFGENQKLFDEALKYFRKVGTDG